MVAIISIISKALAYHSVENIGIIGMGIGLGAIGTGMGIIWLLAGCAAHCYIH